MVICLSAGFLVFKSGIENPGLLIALILLVGGVTSRIMERRKRFLLTAGQTKTNSVAVLGKAIATSAILSALTASVNILQIIGSSGAVPLSTSFDTSSGDMFSYLLNSEGLRTVGWEGYFPHLDVSPSGEGPTTLSATAEHAGAGGYVLLAVFASMLAVPTWAIGSAVVALVWQSLLAVSTYIVLRFSSLPYKAATLLPALVLTSFTFVITIGWWALNQLIFMSLLLMLCVALIVASRLQSRLERSKWFGVSGFLGLLAFETYPSVAAYSMLPILIVSAVWFGIRRTMETKRIDLSALWVVPPFTYSLLGTLQFWPNIFSSQFNHDLTLSVPAPGLFDFMGGAPSGLIREHIPRLEVVVTVLNSSILWGGIILLSFMFIFFRAPGNVLRLLPMYLLGLGGAILIIYSGIIAHESYLAHKLSLTWFPITLFALIILIEVRYHPKPRAVKLLTRLLKVVPLIIVANLTVSMIYFSSFISIGERRVELRKGPATWAYNAVTLDSISLGDSLSKLPIRAILTDFSNGTGWVPLDRTTLPGLFRTTGPLVLSGGSMAGFTYYTGWSIVESAALITSDEVLYQNGSFAIRHTCRLVCADSGADLTAFLLGMGSKDNDWSKYQNSTFFEVLPDESLSLRIIGTPNQKVSIVTSWGYSDSSKSSTCSAREDLLQLEMSREINSGGTLMIALTAPAEVGCDVLLQEVRIN